MITIRKIIVLVSAVFLLNANALAVNGSAIGDGKEVLIIEGCDKAKNFTVYSIELKPDRKWKIETPTETYKGKYEVVIPGEKFSLSPNKESMAKLYEAIGQASKSLCKVKGKILSPKVTKFIAKFTTKFVGTTGGHDAILKIALKVKFKATDGTTREKGVYKVVSNIRYTSNKSVSDLDTEISLSPLTTTEPGTVYSYNTLAGVSNLGIEALMPIDVYKGSIDVTNLPQEMLNGVLVTPRARTRSATNCGGDTELSTKPYNIKDCYNTETVNDISYIDTSGNLVQYKNQTTGVTCTPVSPDTLPSTVKAFDFGINSTLICNNNTMIERHWRTRAHPGGGLLTLRVIHTTKDFNNAVKLVEEESYSFLYPQDGMHHTNYYMQTHNMDNNHFTQLRNVEVYD